MVIRTDSCDHSGDVFEQALRDLPGDLAEDHFLVQQVVIVSQGKLGQPRRHNAGVAASRCVQVDGDRLRRADVPLGQVEGCLRGAEEPLKVQAAAARQVAALITAGAAAPPRVPREFL